MCVISFPIVPNFWTCVADMVFQVVFVCATFWLPKANVSYMLFLFTPPFGFIKPRCISVSYTYSSARRYVECLSVVLGFQGIQTLWVRPWSSRSNELKIEAYRFLARHSAL